jgi:uncharacterized protein YaiE (UPF0345 family)
MLKMIKENTYFDGNVKSLAFKQQGDECSVGVMATGEHTFGTAAPEKMTVVKGALTIKRVDDEEWTTYRDGEAFNVPGNSTFDVKVVTPTAYLCEYL